MQLTEHRNDRQFFLRHADAQSVVVVDRTLQRSFALSATQFIENFPAQAPDRIDAAAVDAILALQPEVVLLGTGARAVFPPQAVLAQFLKRGIGLETMDNAAAARTFNVLVAEDRPVAALLL